MSLNKTVVDNAFLCDKHANKFDSLIDRQRAQLDNLGKAHELDGDRIKGLFDSVRQMDKQVDSLGERCSEGFGMINADIDSKFFKFKDIIIEQNNKLDQCKLVQSDLTIQIDDSIKRLRQLKAKLNLTDEAVDQL